MSSPGYLGNSISLTHTCRCTHGDTVCFSTPVTRIRHSTHLVDREPSQTPPSLLRIWTISITPHLFPFLNIFRSSSTPCTSTSLAFTSSGRTSAANCLQTRRCPAGRESRPSASLRPSSPPSPPTRTNRSAAFVLSTWKLHHFTASGHSRCAASTPPHFIIIK